MNKRRRFGSIVTKQKSPNFYVRFALSGRTYERVAGPDRDTAALRLARIADLLRTGKKDDYILHEVFGDALPEAASLTFRDAVKPYLDDSQGRRKKSTIEGYRYILQAVSRQPWSANELRGIDHKHVKSWITELQKKSVSGSTINRTLCVISSVFRWAIREGYADLNPVSRVQKFSEKGRERETYLSEGEARALVEAAPTDFKPLLICALSTGMRKGEIQRLTWASVDFERRFLTIEPENAKSGRARTIPLSTWLEETLRPMAPPPGAPRQSVLVFRTAAGTPFDDWEIRKRRIEALAACPTIPDEKKPKVSMHVFRHTAASLMVAAGVPIFDVSKILGHGSVLVTMRYAHFAPEASRSAIDALERKLRPESPPGRVSEAVVGMTRRGGYPRAAPGRRPLTRLTSRGR